MKTPAAFLVVISAFVVLLGIASTQSPASPAEDQTVKTSTRRATAESGDTLKLIDLPPAVLVEVSTGRTMSLGTGIPAVAFSGDSKWLFISGQLSTNRGIERVDLSQSDLEPEQFAQGYLPLPNFDGSSVAFSKYGAGKNTLLTYVRRQDGTEIELVPPGFIMAWSPDGRWLAYNKVFGQGPAPVETEREFYIFDGQTGEIRLVDRVEYFGGTDFRTSTEWSSTSQYFKYYAERAVPAQEAGAAIDIDRLDWWRPATNVLYRVLLSDDGSVSLRTHNVATGDIEHTLVEGIQAGVEIVNESESPFSPDGSLMFVRYLEKPGASKVAILRPDDRSTLGPFEGNFLGWSADGGFLLEEDSDACRGIARYSAGGRQIACLLVDLPALSYPTARISGNHLVYGEYTGEQLASAVGLFKLRAIDLNTGQERYVTDYVACVEWSPDGRWLVAGAACQGP